MSPILFKIPTEPILAMMKFHKSSLRQKLWQSLSQKRLRWFLLEFQTVQNQLWRKWFQFRLLLFQNESNRQSSKKQVLSLVAWALPKTLSLRPRRMTLQTHLTILLMILHLFNKIYYRISILFFCILAWLKSSLISWDRVLWPYRHAATHDFPRPGSGFMLRSSVNQPKASLALNWTRSIPLFFAFLLFTF